MPVWTFLDFVDDAGESMFEKWLLSQPPDAQAHIANRILTMEGLENWLPKWATKLVDWDGLVELRISFNKVQYRPLGMYRPGRQFVLLCGAIEKGDKIPRRLLETADTRRKLIEREPNRARPHRY